MHKIASILPRLFRGDLAVISGMSILRLLLHLWVNFTGGYGIFRDELYYLACADHLAAGYVDHPPFSVYLLAFVKALFGDSLFVVRFFPAVAAAFTVFFTGMIAKKLGGNKFAQFLACVCAFSPINLAMSSFYSMNSIDILLWTLVSYIMILIIQDGDKKLWLLLGLLLGIGLLNKIGVLFLGAGLFAGLLFTIQRTWLRTWWPYITGAIAMIFFLPYVIWNLTHDMAHLEFIRNASTQKYSLLTPLDFLIGQLLLNNPFACFIWISGLLALLFNVHLKEYRLLAFLYIGPLVIFIVNGTSKPEYLAPAYGTLWAAGSVWIENTLGKRFVVKVMAGVYIILTTLILIPAVLTILPVEKYISYADMMGIKPSTPENKKVSVLPQFYADMFGWEEKALAVSNLYHSLNEEDQGKCAIYAENYGRCGAIDYFGKVMELPRTIGSHNNYWIWGPRGYTGEVMIILGGEYEEHIKYFESVTASATVDCPYCMPYEDDLNVFLCRNLKVDLQDSWPRVKHFE